VFPSNIVNISVLIQFYYPQPKSLPLPPTFSLVAGWPSHHPRKRAHMLVFDGGGTAFNTTTPSLSKTSRYARFRRWLVVFHHHNSITFENEHTRSFSRVVICISIPLSHNPRKRAYALAFEGGYLYFNTTTPQPSKTSIRARFRGWLFVFQLPLPHNPRKRAYALVFEGYLDNLCNLNKIYDILLINPEKTRTRARGYGFSGVGVRVGPG
jgi:hypothetical protein